MSVLTSVLQVRSQPAGTLAQETGWDWGLCLCRCINREKRKSSKSPQRPSTRACSPACLSTWCVLLGGLWVWDPLPITLAVRACPASVLQPLPLPPEPLRKGPFSGLPSACGRPHPCCLHGLLPQIALLKILLAAAPTSKAKTDSINILADVLPEEMP